MQFSFIVGIVFFVWLIKNKLFIYAAKNLLKPFWTSSKTYTPNEKQQKNINILQIIFNYSHSKKIICLQKKNKRKFQQKLINKKN